MKKFLLFLIGMLVGVGLTIGYLKLSSVMNENDGLELFEQPGKVMDFDALQVVQAIDEHKSLTVIYEYNELSLLSAAFGSALGAATVALFYTQKDNPYYDGQIIKASKGTCFRQVGLYRYETQDGTTKTVPVVSLYKK